MVASDDTTRGRILRQVTTNPGPDREPAWSPDSKQIAYVMNAEPDLLWYATAHLALVPAAGGTPRVLTTALDRNVGSPRFAADGKSIWFLLEDAGERDVARIGVDRSGLTRPVAGPPHAGAFAPSPHRAPVVLVARPPPPRQIIHPRRGTPRPLTPPNQSFPPTPRP